MGAPPRVPTLGEPADTSRRGAASRTPPRDEETPALRLPLCLGVTPASRAPRTDGAWRTPSREGADDELRTEPVLELRLGVPTLRLDDEWLLLRLEPLNELWLDDELLERLPLNELWLDDELLERLLLMELLWPPPLREPPPPPPPGRWANAGVALSARAIIARVMIIEVFMVLLLSFYCCSFRFLVQRYH